MENMAPIIPAKPWLLYEFPARKKAIAALSADQKMEWYAYQWASNPQEATIRLSSAEFERFWRWRVLIPMKLKRLFFRVKNGEIFKKYDHITEMKKKVKKHSI